MALFTLIVILVLLTIGDRVALAIAENKFATQIQQNGLPVKPSVTIEGFPFLTQVLAHDFRQVDISANEIPVSAGPVNINITSVKATIDGLHFTSFSGTSGKADHVTGTVFVSFADLAPGFGSLPAGFSLTQDGPNLVKLTAGLGPLTDTELARVTYTPTKISIQFVNSGSLLSPIFTGLAPFSFSLPAGVPAGLKITNASVTSSGLTATVAGNNVNLSESTK
jgi:LmeA-like phospholipid-binding